MLHAAFPFEAGPGEGEARETLWGEPCSRAAFEALERLATTLPDVIVAQRRQYTAFARKAQFAAARPLRGGGVMLGLALAPEANPRLEAPRSEPWSERLKARVTVEDARAAEQLAELLRRAWERS